MSNFPIDASEITRREEDVRRREEEVRQREEELWERTKMIQGLVRKLNGVLKEKGWTGELQEGDLENINYQLTSFEQTIERSNFISNEISEETNGEWSICLPNMKTREKMDQWKGLEWEEKYSSLKEKVKKLNAAI